MQSAFKLAAVAFGMSLALGSAGFAQSTTNTTTTEKPDGQRTTNSSTVNPSTGQASNTRSTSDPTTGQASSRTTTQHGDGSKTTTTVEKK
jgi:hypothetical protein